MKDLIIVDVADWLPPLKKNFFERTTITRNLTNQHVYDFGKYTKRFYTEDEGDIEKVTFQLEVNEYECFKHHIKNLGKFVLNGGYISFVIPPLTGWKYGTILLIEKITPLVDTLTWHPNDEDALVDLQNLLAEYDFPISFWGDE